MNTDLLTNILDFNLDGPLSEYGFSTRLENENLWTVNFARDAILEYKRYMYLAAVSEPWSRHQQLLILFGISISYLQNRTKTFV